MQNIERPDRCNTRSRQRVRLATIPNILPFLFLVVLGLLVGAFFSYRVMALASIGTVQNGLEIGSEQMVVYVGRFPAKSITEVLVPLTNPWPEVVTVSSIKSSCGCTVANIDPIVIPPNETGGLILYLHTENVASSRGVDLTGVVQVGNASSKQKNLGGLVFEVVEGKEVPTAFPVHSDQGLPEELFEVIVEIPLAHRPAAISPDLVQVVAHGWGDFRVVGVHELEISTKFIRYQLTVEIEALFDSLSGKIRIEFPSAIPEMRFEVQTTVSFSEGFFVVPKISEERFASGETVFELHSTPKETPVAIISGATVGLQRKGAGLPTTFRFSESTSTSVREVQFLVGGEERTLRIRPERIFPSSTVLILDEDWNW